MNLIFITGESQEQHCFIVFSMTKLNNCPVDLSLLYAFFPCCVNADPGINKKRVSDVIRISYGPMENIYMTPALNSTVMIFSRYFGKMLDV